ncbi:MAG: hypothetical protein QGH50_07940 [SAR324 cluster bacterium]|nr:hypothetical protein [SAR324 cluster bacterium]
MRLTTLCKRGWGLVRPWGRAYPGASSSCISIRPGFLCIEGRSLGWLETSRLSKLTRDIYKRHVVMEIRNQRVRQNKGTGANILADFRR